MPAAVPIVVSGRQAARLGNRAGPVGPNARHSTGLRSWTTLLRMPISWNEIRQNAIRFSRDWAGARSETADKQTFWNEFFEAFGIRRRTVASFEEPVRKLSGDFAFIDLLWPRVLLVEHKSRGKNLGAAESQAFAYVHHLLSEGRQEEVPRYIIVSDFARVALHDLEPERRPGLPPGGEQGIRSLEFPLRDFHKHIHEFGFIPGYKQHVFEDQDPINLKAVDIMGGLHDALESGGYSGHRLERFLVRILFCLFAEDTGIFERESFHLYLVNRTGPDGSDLGLHLARLFNVLNTPSEDRQKNLDETLAALPYVNGALFQEDLGFADFNRSMREALLAATRFDWSRISPAIFGSLFQAVMEPRERRQLGGHYTSERDILKVIRALFLDELHREFRSIGKNRAQLRRFHLRLASLRFLDPACGCGNFLVISYRELRLLEIEVLRMIHGTAEQEIDIQSIALVDVDAFYGIEIAEWPARVAEVAMWLMDHQMNIRLSEVFGKYYVRLPLRKSPTIRCENALQADWRQILPRERCSFVLGNPPFVGKKEQSASQKADMQRVFHGVQGAGVLDYVCAWYIRAAQYVQDTQIRVAFVSTNSITQGEQVGILWRELLGRYGIRIHFAHRTFAWQSEASGKAHVHVVIIGFGAFDISQKLLFEYENLKSAPHAVTAANINPYLADAPNVVLVAHREQISGGPPINYGSMANDRRKSDKGPGNLILDRDARARLLEHCPQIEPFVRPYTGSEEFLNNTERWCLWLVGASPQIIRSCPDVRKRVEAVRQARSESNRAETKKLAASPSLFGEIRQPSTRYLLIPKVSSETRPYLPVGFLEPLVIANGSALIIAEADLFHCGVLSSAMHMAWMRYTCGRMKSDYQYSSQIVYNNFPWPEQPPVRRRTDVVTAARTVLDARAIHLAKGATLADLYDPLTMPPELVSAHAALDRAVDLCYRPQPFANERQRIEHLFLSYQKLAAPLTAGAVRRSRKSPSPKR